MAQNFQVKEKLPATECAREDFYQTMETMEPTAQLVDGKKLVVSGGKVQVSLLVPAWVKFTVGHAALKAGAATNNIELFVLPAGGVVHAVKLKHSAQFVGTGITDYKLSVGISGELDKYLAAFDVDTAPSDTGLKLQWNTDNTHFETHASAGTSIRLAATATGADLNASTAGAVDVWVLYSATT